jgi:outer membrane protein TolC
MIHMLDNKSSLNGKSRIGLAITWRGLVVPGMAAVACFALASPTALSAQTGPDDPEIGTMTLAGALSFSRLHYPAVKAALADEEAASREVDVARAAYLPQLNLLAQVNRSTVNNVTGALLPQPGFPSISGPVFPETGQSTWNSAVGVSASWRPFDFGYRSAKVDAARSAAEAAGDSANLTQLEVELATTNAFLNLVAAQKLEQAARANLARLEAFASAVHVLVTNKLRAGVEGEQADAATALARATLISTQANVETQRAILGKLVGRSVTTVVIDASALDGAVPMMAGGSGTANVYPAVRREAARVGQEDATLKAISRSAAPQIDIVGGAFARGSGKTSSGRYLDGSSGLGPDVTNWAVGVQLSFPLGNLPAVHAQQRAQRARLEAQRARYEQALADADERLARATSDLSAARQIETVTPAALQSARATEQQQRIRFQSGLATVVDVTSAEATLAQAESQDAIARLNVWRAQAAMAAAQGDFAPFEQLLRP